MKGTISRRAVGKLLLHCSSKRQGNPCLKMDRERLGQKEWGKDHIHTLMRCDEFDEA